MKRLLLLLSVSLIFSCGPDGETVDAAKIMCDCSENLNWSEVDVKSEEGHEVVSSLYSCLGDSDDFLSYLNMEKDTSRLSVYQQWQQNKEIEDELSKVFKEKKMSIAIEDECPKIYLKMQKAGVIQDQ